MKNNKGREGSCRRFALRGLVVLRATAPPREEGFPALRDVSPNRSAGRGYQHLA